MDDIGYGKQFEGWYDRLHPDLNAAELTAHTLAELHPAPRAGTLELGVGTGRIARPLARRIGSVDGLDSSPEMLSALRSAAAEHGEAVEALHADMRTYAASRRYGLVYAVCATLNQVLSRADQQEVVRRAAQLLVPGGKLVIEAHNRTAVLAIHGGLSRTSFFTPYPEPGTGLLTFSTLSAEHDLWQCSQIWHENDGTTRVGTEYSLLLAPSDVHAYARSGSLTTACPESGFADWSMAAPATADSPTFIVVYEKPDL